MLNLQIWNLERMSHVYLIFIFSFIRFLRHNLIWITKFRMNNQKEFVCKLRKLKGSEMEMECKGAESHITAQ